MQRLVRIAAVCAMVTVLVSFASTAQAATPQAGLWYYDVLHVQAAHDAGWTGKGVTIAVIDGQLNLEVPTLADANIVVEPSLCKNKAGAAYPATTTSLAAAHATGVTSLLVGSGAGYSGQVGVKGVAPDAKILFYMAAPGPRGTRKIADCYSHGAKDPRDPIVAAINDAVRAGAQIISVSLIVPASPELEYAEAQAEHKGVVIVAGLEDVAGETIGTSGSSPGTDNGVVSVQAEGSNGALNSTDGRPNITANTDVVGAGVGILEQGNFAATGGSWQDQSVGDGTSWATPIVAGFLAMVKQKYPAATGNQLIQTLIRNTGTANHALVRDTTGGFGFGSASATHMLQVDPAQYPDTNPLIGTGANAQPPSAVVIAHPPTLKKYLQLRGVTSDPGTSTQPPKATTGSASWVPIAIVGGIVGLLVVAGLIVLIVVMVARSRRRGRT
jgi:subtilisin family serine protease